jgi:sarcosine oxidase
VAVIGAGIVGAAAARALARRGYDVVLVEQFGLGHARGGSHGATRIFRLAYADPELVRLAEEALEGWRALEQEHGEPLLAVTGLLQVATDFTPFTDALDACGVDWEELGAEDVRSRFGIALPAGATALLQGLAGVVFAARALSAFTADARAHGTTVLAETTVRGLDPDAGGVRLATSRGDLQVDAVVVAAGAWADRLLAPLGVDLELRASRETVLYLRLNGRTPVPALIDWTERPEGQPAYALHDPVHGLKVGLDHAGAATDPARAEEPDAELIALSASWAAERFPAANPRPVATDTCLYADRPGGRFALERHGRVVVASACSGHGFKFAPALGERLAALTDEALDQSVA